MDKHQRDDERYFAGWPDSCWRGGDALEINKRECASARFRIVAIETSIGEFYLLFGVSNGYTREVRVPAANSIERQCVLLSIDFSYGCQAASGETCKQKITILFMFMRWNCKAVHTIWSMSFGVQHVRR